MTPRRRRRWIDLAVSILLTLPIFIMGCTWAGILSLVYGLWSYWDGMTRLDLPDHLDTRHKTPNGRIDRRA